MSEYTTEQEHEYDQARRRLARLLSLTPILGTAMSVPFVLASLGHVYTALFIALMNTIAYWIHDKNEENR